MIAQSDGIGGVESAFGEDGGGVDAGEEGGGSLLLLLVGFWGMGEGGRVRSGGERRVEE